jgi:hypothetical protein
MNERVAPTIPKVEATATKPLGRDSKILHATEQAFLNHLTAQKIVRLLQDPILEKVNTTTEEKKIEVAKDLVLKALDDYALCKNCSVS